MKTEKFLLFLKIKNWWSRFKLKLVVVASIAIAIMSFKILYPDPPPGYTGSPGDGSNCTLCHADYALNVANGTIVSVTSDIPGSGYVAGNTYSVTATISNAPVSQTEFQFQLSPQTTGGSMMGTLIAGPNSALNQGGPYNAYYINGNPATLTNSSWTFSWTAPAANSGTVTFYAAFVAADANLGIDGDYVYTTTLIAQEAVSLPLTSVITNSANANCNGICDGTATVTASGGTSPYTYLWSQGTQTSASATGLCAGSASVTVTDASSNASVATVSISEPTALIVNLTQTPDSGAANGTATANVSGGTSSYTYLWSNGQTAATATGLAAGSYTVTVTDGNNCTNAGSVTVITFGALYGTVSSSNATCSGTCNGSATVTAFDGTSPYTYLWSNGITTTAANGLCDTIYTVTITDAASASFVVSATITSPPALATSMSSTANNGSNSGTATVTASGGTTPYTYLWENGQANSTATGLGTGTIFVTVTDANNCMKTDSVDIVLGLNSPEQASSLKIYPNPGTGEFSLAITSSKNANGVISILDLNGREIYNEKIILIAGENVVPVLVNTSIKGVYVFRLISEDSVIHLPVTITK